MKFELEKSNEVFFMENCVRSDYQVKFLLAFHAFIVLFSYCMYVLNVAASTLQSAFFAAAAVDRSAR